MKAFVRPARPHQPPPWRQPRPPVPDPLSDVPRANLQGTFAALVGIGLTVAFMDGRTPASIATFVAIGTAISLAISVAFDLRAGYQPNVLEDPEHILIIRVQGNASFPLAGAMMQAGSLRYPLPCGADKSSAGPIGTMRVGLIWSCVM